jgi:hypothetical protein
MVKIAENSSAVLLMDLSPYLETTQDGFFPFSLGSHMDLEATRQSPNAAQNFGIDRAQSLRVLEPPADVIKYHRNDRFLDDNSPSPIFNLVNARRFSTLSTEESAGHWRPAE